jgi:DNA-binding transcriptional LysR family regulator
MVHDVSELRIGDLLTFLAVARSASLTAAARERRVTPSQVSKALNRIEAHFGKRLVDRGSRGVALTERGRMLVPTLENVVRQLETARTADSAEARLTLGAPSYLQAAMLPVLAGAVPNVRVSAFELPPSVLRANAQDEGFDLLLLPGEPGHLPPSWHTELVGELKKSLYASPALAHQLGPQPLRAEALVDIPWVSPVWRRDGRAAPTNDDCPLPRARRRVGHEVQTMPVGLEVAAATNQLIFGPSVAAQQHLRAGTLVELSVEGWDVRDPLSFVCHVDRVSAKNRVAFATKLRAAMRSL